MLPARIDQAYIGSCANGTQDDLELAAAVLRGRRVASGVHLIVVPASQTVYRDCLKSGAIAALVEAGATIAPPTCGACGGGHMGTWAYGHMGVLAEQEVCITSSTRNFKGRMGEPSSRVYMASPATVAAYFGIGSCRPAARSLKNLGLACLVAPYINGMFFRNAVNFAFLPSSVRVWMRHSTKVILPRSTSSKHGCAISPRALSLLPKYCPRRYWRLSMQVVYIRYWKRKVRLRLKLLQIGDSSMLRCIVFVAFMLTHLCNAHAAAKGDEAVYRNYMAAASELTKRDDHAGAISQLAAAVSNAEAFGANDLRLASALYALGRARRALHDYAPAEASYLRALDILDRAAGDVRERMAAVLNGLGEINQLRGRYDDAEGYYEEELAVREQIAGPHHPSVAYVLSNNLAAIYRFQARHADVEATYRRSLAILDKSVPPTDTQLGLALIDLAEWCLRMSKYAEAETYYRRGIPIVQAMFPPAHFRVLQLMEDWGSVNFLQGRYADAESTYKTLLTTVEKSLGEQHPSVGAALNNLVALYETQGRNDVAEAARKRMLEVSNVSFRGLPYVPMQVQPGRRR